MHNLVKTSCNGGGDKRSEGKKTIENKETGNKKN